ncbi:polypeptide n-acetylgalactosaminyltransferase [Plakobranchus ocellatus]|uniref:Polypeptide N-acetylgalactosaminyltransferase n=1 Tax=Plakobranchus ocellatus TaxID=259542 RepID=A0AAV3Z428_9GAST|nr:polypeptide n-acetylgalactosaminyltransferase [Plakobranchus ocellatus]
MKRKKPPSFAVLLLAVLSTFFILWKIIMSAVKEMQIKPDLTLDFDITVLEKLHFIPHMKETDISTFNRHYGYSIAKSLSKSHTRSLRDTRDIRCQSLALSSPVKLPSVSVVVTYSEVDRSVLLRNIASIVQRSRPTSIKEIVVVDDGSSDGNAGKLLQRLKGIQVIRNIKPKGRGIARMQGASVASAEIIIFIDILSEMNEDWLSPLLRRLSESPKSLVTPVFDSIDPVTFEYQSVPGIHVGGIDWSLRFRWEEISWNQMNKSDFNISFTKYPIQPGAVFAIRKDFFNWLGKYDMGSGGSGTEDIDLSLRVWLCGGQVELIPCSRVGLINTSRGLLGVQRVPFSSYLRGAKKIAELWLDEYKRFFYAVRPSARMQPLSDLSSFRKLKEKNKCHSFKWFLTNIYPQLLPLVSEEIAYGSLRQSDNCIDLDPGQMPLIAKLRPCKADRNSQEWSWRKKGLIVSNGMCLSSDLINMHGYVVVQFCQDFTSQKWYRKGLKIVHHDSSLCLDSVQGDLALIIADCVKDLPTQAWHFASELGGLPSSKVDFGFSNDKTQL